MPADRPTVNYWRLWTDDGLSRQDLCQMTAFELKSIGPPAEPQWQGRAITKPTTVMTTVLPVGWTGDWHENPRPQWIVPLSGRWFVESMDGARIEFGAGDLSFGGDQECRTVDGKRGHRSGTVGDAPAVLMLVQYEPSEGPSADDFR
jgi:hypothetical protein